MSFIMIKRSLCIMVVLLSTAQIDAMQYNYNHQLTSDSSNSQDSDSSFSQDSDISVSIFISSEKILNKLNSICDILIDQIKKETFPNISKNIMEMDFNILSYLYEVLDKLPLDKTTPEILFNISKMNKDKLKELCNDLKKSIK